ncbi:hypothetical protein AB0P17_39495 [Streptomyces sp. NPDC088124]|uniref:hypothetical protein n=1 Tax=Streptomyces sp. NPDC088124 TaxID=3154654 RepID=UPI003419AEB7
MNGFTGSSTLGRGGGFFRFAGTGDASAFATVFRDTRYRRANARPDTAGSKRRSRRIRSKVHSRDLYTRVS